jgi:hypothetical protein
LGIFPYILPPAQVFYFNGQALVRYVVNEQINQYNY